MSHTRRFIQDFEATLFGHVLGVTGRDLVIISVVAGPAGLAVLILYKPLLFSTFDEEVAQVYGVPTRNIRLLFSCSLAIPIPASVQVLGVTLSVAATGQGDAIK